MAADFVRGTIRSLGLVASMLLTIPAIAAEYDAAAYAALVKALPEAEHTLTEGIEQVTKGGELAIEAKFLMGKRGLLLSVFTSENGRTDAEHSVFKEYSGLAAEATW